MNYLLDTNIVITYLRNTVVTQKLEAALNLLSGSNNLVVSVVSLGEIRSISKRNNWGEKKRMALDNIVKGFLIADINVEDIIERYAEIDAYSQGKLGGETIFFFQEYGEKRSLDCRYSISAKSGIINNR